MQGKFLAILGESSYDPLEDYVDNKNDSGMLLPYA